MLIDKRNTPDVNDIVTIKLVSGEEIVGRLVEKTIDSVFLAKPVHVVMQPVSEVQMGLTMRPVLGSVSDMQSVQFPLASLSIRPLKTGDDVRRNYVQATTGLMTPTAEQTGLVT